MQNVVDAPLVRAITAPKGSILIFCVGVDLIWGKTFRVANMLPSVVIAMTAALLA